MKNKMKKLHQCIIVMAALVMIIACQRKSSEIPDFSYQVKNREGDAVRKEIGKFFEKFVTEVMAKVETDTSFDDPIRTYTFGDVAVLENSLSVDLAKIQYTTSSDSSIIWLTFGKDGKYLIAYAGGFVNETQFQRIIIPYEWAEFFWNYGKQ